MTASFEAYEHFIATGEFKDLPAPEGVIQRNPTPYYTYEIGIDEMPHPAMDLATRLVEITKSDCEYGCRIYADIFTEIRILVHSQTFGCRRTVAEINASHEGDEIRPGDLVEFKDFENPLVIHNGRVLNTLPPNEESGFTGGFHVGSYYVLGEEDLRKTGTYETYQQAYARLREEGLGDQQIADHLGVEVGLVRSMRNDAREPVDGTEYAVGQLVHFWDDDDVKRPAVVRRYLPPTYDNIAPKGGFVVEPLDEDEFYVVSYRNRISA